MKKSNKVIRLVAVAALSATMFPIKVYAADPDYSDTSYWTKYCTDLSNAQSSSCSAFLSYAANQSSALSETLQKIDSQRSTIATNIQDYEKKINDYQTQIDDLNTKIDDLTSQIDTLTASIEDKKNQAQDLKTKVSKQIANSQGTMRLSKEVDILMGAKTFADFLRIAAGLADITEHSQKNLNDLVTVTNELTAAQEELTKNQEDLQTTQDDALAKQYEAQVIQQEYEKQDADLEQQQNEYLSLSTSFGDSQEAIQSAIAEAERLAEQARQEEERKRQEEEQRRQEEINNGNSGNNNSGNNSSNDNNGGSTPSYDDSTIGYQVVNYARQFIGNPYVYGGTDPYNGIDCSAFTQYIYRQFGIWLPRTSYQQENCGTIISYADAQPGDLITWDGHCGIYSGSGMVVNAMDPSWGIREVPVSWIYNGRMLIHRLW